MAGKLRAKSFAMSDKASAGELFRVRAVSAQIGWLGTPMADAAAETVSNVELLLSVGAPKDPAVIDNQLKFLESYEFGLLATWETPHGLVCAPRQV
jgi:hypothetical protein